MKFDVLSLGDHLPDPHTRQYHETQAGRYRFWVELGVQAESLGYDAFWIGEHHCSDYIVSSPQMVLSAIASRTRRITLGTAVSLLPTNDPVRLAEDFATLDLLSEGRAQISFGSGFTEHTFALFGKDSARSAEIGAEHLELLEHLWNSTEDINWQGVHRSPIHESRVQPRTLRGKAIPINRATASSRETAEHAGRHGHRLMLMTVAGRYADMRPLADIYREAYERAGHPREGMSVAALAYVHVKPDGDAARRFWHPYRDNYRAFTAVLKESKVLTRGIQALYEQIGAAGFANREPDFCGAPEEITEKVLRADADLGGIDRLLCLVDCGGIAGPAVLESVEQFSRDVMPVVRAELGATQAD